MSLTWSKVWRDMWHNKLRTLLVVLSTAVGVFALGLVFGLSGVTRARMTEEHRAMVPAHITFWWVTTFDQETVETIARMPGVADAEGEAWDVVRWKVEGEPDWRDGTAILVARADYAAQRMNRADLLNGRWPAKDELAADGLTTQYFDVSQGEIVIIEFERYERRLPVVGVLRHPTAQPPQLGGDPIFFTTPETFARLTGQEEGFHRLHLRLESFNEENANEVAAQVQERLEAMGLWVSGYGITDPNVHDAQDEFDSVTLILTVMGVLSLGLSGFLVINTMNALVTQQVWQIGVMKAVGATKGRVMGVYLTVALIYGLLSLLLAVPLGAVGAYLMADWLLELVQTEVGAFRIMPTAIVIQIGMGVLVPFLAAFVPATSGARITVHQAISRYGLGAGFGRSWLDRLIGQIRNLPRSLALSLRNTFRRKARVILTLLTLVLGGVMFIMVMSASASMTNTIDVLLEDFGFDVSVWTDRFYRADRLIEATEGVPGIVKAEVALRRGAELSLPGGGNREVGVWGVPLDSEMFRPRIVSGRELLPRDGRAILLNKKIAEDEGFRVGDAITMTIDDRESTWTVVGLIQNVNNDQRDNFVPFDALGRATGNTDLGGTVWVMAEEHDLEAQQSLIRNLREVYPTRRIEASYFESAEEIKQRVQMQFDLITSLLMSMAILASLVGSIGLTSTMSINVVERAREIGVMRAIGAKTATILGIFIAEGILVGVLSWLLAVPLSYPGASTFSHQIGVILFDFPLDFSYSTSGVILWLAIVAVLSALASLWPAIRATRVSVREALAYE